MTEMNLEMQSVDLLLRDTDKSICFPDFVIFYLMIDHFSIALCTKCKLSLLSRFHFQKC